MLAVSDKVSPNYLSKAVGGQHFPRELLMEGLTHLGPTGACKHSPPQECSRS